VKKITFSSFVFFLSFLLPFSLHAFTTVAHCSQTTSPGNCVEVTSCQGIDTSDRYYLLMNNVTSQGTCFYMNTGNFTFDLNGHTVNFAQSSSGNAFRGTTGANDSVEIKNGYIRGNAYSYSHAVNFTSSGSDDLKIHDLDIVVAGLQTDGLIVRGGMGVEIHDVIIDMDSEKEDITDHAVGHIQGIWLTGRGGKIRVYNNRITGRGMFGIAATSCGQWDVATHGHMEINNNYVSIWSPVRDGYAINIAGHNNACRYGTKIYGNTIEQTNGRGIIVDGWGGDASDGPSNIEIYENDIYVQEGFDCEYEESGTAAGIRIRFGAHDVYAHDNLIKGKAGTGLVSGIPSHCPNGHATMDASKVVGMYLGSGNPYGVNNIYHDNYVDVSTNDIRYPAIGVYVAGGTRGHSMPSFFEGNTFKSNSQPVRISWNDGTGHNAFFKSTTIIKGDNPLAYQSITMGYYGSGATDVDFLDTTGVNGASVYDIHFNSGTYENITISWTLNVVVQDGNSNPLSNASVKVENTDGTSVFQDNTDSLGRITSEIIERSYPGGNEDILTPHTITVVYNGQTQTRVVSLTSPTTELFTFGASTYNCGDINKDGAINFGDIQFLLDYFFHQGPEPDPLLRGDVTLDGSVDIADIVHLVNFLYQGGPDPCDQSPFLSDDYSNWTEQDIMNYINEARYPNQNNDQDISQTLNNNSTFVTGGCGLAGSGNSMNHILIAMVILLILLLGLKRKMYFF